MAFSLFRLSRLALATSLLGLAACQGAGQSPPAAPTAKPAAGAIAPPVVVPHLVEQALGKSGFTVLLPATYALKTTDGPDFLVYYFAPADTTVRTSFTGGLYFGNNPQGQSPVPAGCQERRVPATLLGRPATWAVCRCATGYTLNTVFDSHSGQGWNEKINAFGEARSAAELRQLLAVFATLRQTGSSARQ